MATIRSVVALLKTRWGAVFAVVLYLSLVVHSFAAQALGEDSAIDYVLLTSVLLTCTAVAVARYGNFEGPLKESRAKLAGAKERLRTGLRLVIFGVISTAAGVLLPIGLLKPIGIAVGIIVAIIGGSIYMAGEMQTPN